MDTEKWWFRKKLALLSFSLASALIQKVIIFSRPFKVFSQRFGL